MYEPEGADVDELKIENPSSRTSRDRTYLYAVCVALLTLAAYLASTRNDFVNWDDDKYIYQNHFIRSFDPEFFRWAFFEFYTSNWHPLTWMSHAADYALWGLNPMGHHLTNIILHAVNTFLVVMLTQRLIGAAMQFGDQRSRALFSGPQSVTIAAVGTGLLFGLHPVHVESVAWIAERKDLLCGLFFLLSVMAYCALDQSERARHGAPFDGWNPAPRWRNKYYFFALGSFILALMSKPMAVSLPIVLLILDWYPFGRISSFKTFLPALAEKLPFAGLSLLSSVLTVFAQEAGGALSSLEAIPLSIRILTAAGSLVAYLGKMIAPVHLIAFYPYPQDASLFSFHYAAAILFVAGITGVALFTARKHPLIFSVWGYYVITLLPVLGLVQVGDQVMADRYTYIPSIGPFLSVGIATAWIAGKLERTGRRSLTVFAACAAFCLVVVLLILTVLQVRVWKNSETLWSTVLEHEPLRARVAYFNLGDYYQKSRQYEKAIDVYDRIIAIQPSAFCYYNRGLAFSKMGLLEKAIEDYDRAIARSPLFNDSYYAKGVACASLGRLDKAIESYDRYVAMNPSDYRAYNNRGHVYYQLKQFEKALQDYNRSIQLNDRFGLAFGNRGMLYISTGQREAAVFDFSRACELGERLGCDLAVTYRAVK